ncbi:hypothetical protein [Nocardioides panzhihuensis]|uniref:Uncharacterized protein n=1 Tax=Nocardioides panzhihuensis TaxID=860243 RepID=A0A7Z0DPF3_9ACTN|nr:hypothetical protein [Nocardioides panzhihuensis]NYI79349.1 hypothetical protein [Nocardioides panzhihuensis]
MSYAAPPPPPPLTPQSGTDVTGSAPRSTMATTIVVITTVVLLQIGIALVGLVLIYLLGGTAATMTIVTIVTIVLNALLYAVVAGGAAVIARTPTGRLLGIALPMLAWLLNTVLWHALVELFQFYNPVVVGLLAPLVLLLVLAGWGCAAWTGRRWLIGLPATYVLLIVVHVPLSIALTPALSFDNFAAAQLWSALSALVTTVAVVLGGVVCWLLARSEQDLRK